MEVQTFSKSAVVALTGLTYRQIDHWARTGVVVPFQSGRGKGSRRAFSFQDLVALRLARKFREDGLSLQKIRRAVAWLRKHFPDVHQPLAELRLVTDGATLFVVDRDLARHTAVIIDALRQGQMVFSCVLGEIIEDLRGAIHRLATPRKTKVQMGGRTYSITLTPDLEDGGFTARCDDEPAAISHGATEQEAMENVIDAIALCLEHDREWRQADKVRAG